MPNVKKTIDNDSVGEDQASTRSVDAAADKCYIPDVFTGQHVTELSTENSHLKNKVDLICCNISPNFRRRLKFT